MASNRKNRNFHGKNRLNGKAQKLGLPGFLLRLGQFTRNYMQTEKRAADNK